MRRRFLFWLVPVVGFTALSTSFFSQSVWAKKPEPEPGRKVPRLSINPVLGAEEEQFFVSAGTAGGLPEPWSRVLTNVKINDDATTQTQHEPFIAVYGDRVYADFKDWRTGRKHDWFSYSADSGNTWAANYQLPEPFYFEHSDPVVAVDNSGRVYAHILGYGGGESDVFVLKSTNGGVSFGAAVKASNSSADAFQDKNWFTVSATGDTIYCTWSAFLDTLPGVDIRCSRSINGGTSFEPWVKVNDDPSGSGGRQWSSPLIAPSGSLYVFWGWDSRSPSGDGGIYFARSTDGGQSFGANQFVHDQIMYDTMVWRTALVTQTAIDPNNGNLYIAWYDTRLNEPVTDIFFVRSTDGGVSWSEVVVLNDDPGGGAENFMPTLAVDNKGWVHAIWYDSRNGGGNIDVYYTFSTDQGQTWYHPNIRLTTVGSRPKLGGASGNVMGDYIGLATDNQNIYANWGDSRNLNQDIYFVRLAHLNLAPVLDRIGNKSIFWTDTLQFLINATDPNATIPVLTAENLPGGASFVDNGNGTGEFFFKPSETQIDSFVVEFIASDGVLADTEQVTIEVRLQKGDANADGLVDAVDAVYLINSVFFGGAEPVPVAAGDVDCNGVIDLVDIIQVINLVFLSIALPC